MSKQNPPARYASPQEHGFGSHLLNIIERISNSAIIPTEIQQMITKLLSAFLFICFVTIFIPYFFSRKHQISKWASLLLIPVTIVGIIFLISLKEKTTTTKTSECIQDSNALESVEGIIKKASSGYYVYNGRWRFIVHGCQQTRKSKKCLQNNPGIILLEENIGKPVVVKFCSSNAIEYSISGTHYSTSDNKEILQKSESAQ